MTVIFLLIPLSVVMALVFLGAFIWAVRSGQYEDTVTPSLRLLLPDPETRGGSTSSHQVEKPLESRGELALPPEETARDRARRPN